MRNRTPWILLVAALVAATVFGAAWHQANVDLSQLRMGGLKSIAALLTDDQELLRELQSSIGTEQASSILASYLAEIRADGLPKHADMKQRLDRIAESNSAILTLIDVYSPNAKTSAFSTESNKFRRYAIAWRDRWNSVMELFMAGGSYPVAEVPFPKEFVGAVQSEIEAAQSIR